MICSDGDLMEGVSQEAASIAGHFGLGKLIVCYDDNHITIDGTTALSFDGENHPARLRADGWHVQQVADSEDVDALDAALSRARAETERPSFIAIRSHIAYPAPHAVDTAKSHGSRARGVGGAGDEGGDGLRSGSLLLGGCAVYEHMSLIDAGAAAQQGWSERFDSWRAAFPDMAADWDRAWAGRLRDGWRRRCPASAPARTSPRARPARRRWPPSATSRRR